MNAPAFIDVFVAPGCAGNRAALVALESWPADDEMQQVAAAQRVPATAFIVAADEPATWAIRWFSPEAEIGLCGHGTLAAACWLFARNTGLEALRFRIRSGAKLDARREPSGCSLGLPAVAVSQYDWPQAVTAMGGAVIGTWRSPLGYTVLLYATEAEIRALSPDLAALAALGTDQFIATAPGDASDIVSRVFVPGAGNDEDAVTGSAHAVLGPFWAGRLGIATFTAIQASTQGGRLTCHLNGDIVWVGGDCRLVDQSVLQEAMAAFGNQIS